MKRITWIAMLSVAALIAAGCTKVETQNGPDSETEVQPAGSATPQEPGKENGGEGAKAVPGAIGKALLKGLAGGSESDKDDPGQAPEYEP